MPSACREGDLDAHTGHSISGSPNVFINGLAACREQDEMACDESGDDHPQTGTIVSGSATVSINGLAAARVGDSTAYGCGDGEIISGSGNVNIGG